MTSPDVNRAAIQRNGAKEGPPVAVRTRAELSDPEQAVSHEAPKGNDLLIVGLDSAMPAGGFNPEIAKAARAYEGPSAIVVARGVHNDDPIGGAIKNSDANYWHCHFPTRCGGQYRTRARYRR